MPSRTSFLFCAFFVINTLSTSRGWTQELVLEFPQDQVHGTVEVYEPPTVSTGYLSRGELISAQPAMGTVTVPAGKFVNLKLNGIAAHHISILAKLPPGSINGLEINQCSLSPLDFKLISRFDHLRLLSLSRCTLADELTIESLDISESVEDLRFAVQEDSQIEKIVCWGARLPSLSFVFCDNRHFNASEISHFANHTHAAFLPVQISADAAELFASLKTIPQLVGLNLVVQADAPDGWWDALPDLKKVEHINWSGGKITSDLLSSMANMPSLRSLVLQGSTVLAEDFPQGLVKLTNLENLVLHHEEAVCDVEDIYAALAKLKRLKSWPGLKSPSRVTLRALSTVADRTSIEIDGLGEDATQDDLLSALSTNSLKVALYPSVFLIDRQGVLRVAQPHRVGLRDAVGRLMSE